MKRRSVVVSFDLGKSPTGIGASSILAEKDLIDDLCLLRIYVRRRILGGREEPTMADEKIIGQQQCTFCDGKGRKQPTGQTCEVCKGTGQMPIYEKKR